MSRRATHLAPLWCRLATLLVFIGVGLTHLCFFFGVGLPHIRAMAPKRRTPSMPVQEIAERASLETHVTQSAAARLLQPRGKGRGKGLRQARRRFAEMLKKPSLQCTPYGQVVKQLEVDTDSGPVHVDYVCPHAWLYIACLQCQLFAQFLTGCLSQGLPGQGDLAGSICIYSDEAQPGNVLRPDRGRNFLAVYWGITEMPDFFRSRGLWWMTLMYVPSSLVKTIKAGLSALYVKILECFWGVTATCKDWAFDSLWVIHSNTST